jgi:hypothetical protein
MLAFEVECSEVQPGESVYVVGGKKALGDWNPAMALPMTKSTGTLWMAEPIEVTGGVPVEFNFAILGKDRAVSRLESVSGKRMALAWAGEKILIQSKWNVAKMNKKVQSVDPTTKLMPPGSPFSTVSTVATLNDAVDKNKLNLDLKAPLIGSGGKSACSKKFFFGMVLLLLAVVVITGLVAAPYLTTPAPETPSMAPPPKAALRATVASDDVTPAAMDKVCTRKRRQNCSPA